MTRGSRVSLGAVGYLNARPLVYGLEHSERFAIRFDVPARCAELLHGGAVAVGLIPSIEYLRGPAEGGRYCIVPDLAIASRGPVASVALFTTRPMADVQSIALDASSRTSVALVRVLCARVFKTQPTLQHREPDLVDMLSHNDAALIIGDNALMLESGDVRLDAEGRFVTVEKIDLGGVWTATTGLPFVYAFWAGREQALEPPDVAALQAARDAGERQAEQIARDYFPASPAAQAVGARYLRDNIKSRLGADERAGLELFYRYAAEAAVVGEPGQLRFYS